MTLFSSTPYLPSFRDDWSHQYYPGCFEKSDIAVPLIGMLWHFLEVACELLAAAFLIALLLVMAICRSNSHLRDREDFEAFQTWDARQLEEQRELHQS